MSACAWIGRVNRLTVCEVGLAQVELAFDAAPTFVLEFAFSVQSIDTIPFRLDQ
jgi:hypothetical protein